MEPSLLLLLLVIALALAFDFINGFHDTANAIATVVSTKVMSPRTAVIFGAVLNLLGALMGTAVAATIGKGLVDQKIVTLEIVLCCLIGAIIWNLFTWYKGLPTSSSHALIGSLLGATFFGVSGNESISWDNVMLKVINPMIVSPVLGLLIAYSVMVGLIWAIHKVSVPRINKVFGRLQIFSSGVMALSHGHNDAQKSMGIIALALVTYSPQAEFTVPLWVILSCAIAMGLGTLMGGWRIIRTLGSKMIKIQPIHGFAAETTAATIIMGASHFGMPISTTQVISSSILGVGATKRLSAVKWNVVINILIAWLFTLPTTFILSGILSWLYQNILG